VQSVVVVGASLAGLRTVEALRRRGFTGELILVGNEGYPPYDRPPLSKQVLCGDWEADKTRFRQKQGYDELDLDLRLGCAATRVDTDARLVALDDGTDLNYDRLVIATGATPRRLPNPDGLSGIHVLRGLDDVMALQQELSDAQHVAVVGAGFIGLEVASSCRKLGLAVTAIDPLQLPLSPVLGDEMARELMELHVAQGVRFETGAGVAGFAGERTVQRVELSDGRAVEPDVVVVGIGVTPNVQWLRDSRIELDNGVLCDAHCETSVPGVYAVGDVANFHHATQGKHMRIEHWTHAVEMANAAVEHMIDPAGAAPFAPVPYFWSDQYNVKLQFAGMRSADDEVRVLMRDPEKHRLLAAYHRDGALTAVLAWNRPAQLIQCRRMLGEGAQLSAAVEAFGS